MTLVLTMLRLCDAAAGLTRVPATVRGNVVNAAQVGHPCRKINPQRMETDDSHGLG
jgi:hypothetical protein